MLQMTNTWNEFPKVLCNSNVQNQKNTKKTKKYQKNKKIPKKQKMLETRPSCWGGQDIGIFCIFCIFVFFLVFLFFWVFLVFFVFLFFFCIFVFLVFLLFFVIFGYLFVYLFIYLLSSLYICLYNTVLYHVLCKMYWNMSFLCSIFTVNMHEILVCGGSRGGDHIYIYIYIDWLLFALLLPHYHSILSASYFMSLCKVCKD